MAKTAMEEKGFETTFKTFSVGEFLDRRRETVPSRRPSQHSPSVSHVLHEKINQGTIIR